MDRPHDTFFAGLIFVVGLALALSTHGALWYRVLLALVFSCATAFVVSFFRAAWRDRWFWRESWRTLTRRRP